MKLKNSYLCSMVRTLDVCLQQVYMEISFFAFGKYGFHCY